MVTGLEAGGMVAGTEIDAHFLSGIVDAYPIGRFVTQILSAQNDAGDPVVHGLGGRLEVDMLGTGEQQGVGGDRVGTAPAVQFLSSQREAERFAAVCRTLTGGDRPRLTLVAGGLSQGIRRVRGWAAR